MTANGRESIKLILALVVSLAMLALFAHGL